MVGFFCSLYGSNLTGSTYGIFTYVWLMFMVNATLYGISPDYLPTFNYYKNQPNAGQYASPMDPMGIVSKSTWYHMIGRTPGNANMQTHTLELSVVMISSL